MYIESVQLKNFRNYDSLELDLAQGTNIFYGNNAQGKTNILEALYLCGTTKSHKGSRDKDMIQFGKDESHIRMMVKRDELSYRIDMHLKKNKAKGVAINGLPIRKASELFGVVNLVFFSPEDLNIIKNGPGERRRFLDLELCQLDKIYLTNLASYNHIVNQRNKLLKDICVQPSLKETLDIWDMQMAEYGQKIIDKRSEFIQELNETVRKIHANLTGGLEELEIVYEPDCTAGKLESVIHANREKDMRMRLTSEGPHRDDMCVMANGVDIRKYGSQGQQRTAALSLKLSEIYIVKRKIKDTPILLLDDVLSELDSSRQNYLLDSIRDIQTLITCTGLDDFISHQFQINKVFQVVQGTVSQSA
ncbi:DNA replication/repair protein RecF [Blautia wexlerae]|jgi:DNA replication and repair protein RecF|uniref:DNA replication/repair protein RecF n=1 Tax=Blautia wexlerae TaxID=418240 RepID=UPI001570C22D|nr:DNA replication/repair protein RecF [Blautia wexlerae]NSE03740.1 DNA replication/repair protein RecF [Blautia wexlerae]NSF77541.1 DNA replication/repair protein RecF [Blautia wexlerae]